MSINHNQSNHNQSSAHVHRQYLRPIKKQTSRRVDALSFLKADHVEIKALFKKFEAIDDDFQKQYIASSLCNQLTLHTMLEEELLYPAARMVMNEDELIDKADVEHQSAKQLINEIECGYPGEEKWIAKVIVLGELVNRHIKEEEAHIFPRLRKSSLNMRTLGESMVERKVQLQNDIHEIQAFRFDEDLLGL